MNDLLMTLYDKDVFPKREVSENIKWKDRITGKIVLINSDKKIALIGNKINDYLMLPGGGIEDDEDVRQGVARECLEETGSEVELIHELGLTDDYRSRDSKHCINYGFVGRVISQSKQKLTENEKSVGLYVKWLEMNDVIKIFDYQKKLLSENKIEFYNTGFNIIRDSFYIKRAKEWLEKVNLLNS